MVHKLVDDQMDELDLIRVVVAALQEITDQLLKIPNPSDCCFAWLMNSSLNQKLQFRLFIEPLHTSWRVSLVVPNPVLVTIAEEQDRPLTIHRFQAIRIQLCLVLAITRASVGPFRFDRPQRFAIVAPENVIDKSWPRKVAFRSAKVAFIFRATFAERKATIRHSGHGKLTITLLIQRPSGFLQQQIDEVVPASALAFQVATNRSVYHRATCRRRACRRTKRDRCRPSWSWCPRSIRWPSPLGNEATRSGLVGLILVTESLKEQLFFLWCAYREHHEHDEAR
jgi:hypothetical protein